MRRIGWSAFTVMGALALFPLCAGAEIYGWVDPSGDVTYSNLPPPNNARVIEVIPEATPLTPQQQAAATAAHDAEMKSLNDRVQQLERELRTSRMMEAPPYPVAAPSPYGAPPAYAAAPPYPSYDAGPGYGGCNPDFYDCDAWDGPIYYSTGFTPWWGYWHRGFDEFRRHGGGHHDFNGPTAPRFAGSPTAARGSVAHVAGYGGGHAPSGSGHSR